MKFATVVLLGILVLGSFPSLNAQTGAAQVVIAYINEPNSPQPPVPPGFDGVCLTYYTMVGDLDLKSLFANGTAGTPQVDRAHAYFIWVSDFSARWLTENGKYTMILIPEGTGTIYYTNNPLGRFWGDPTRSTWGEPVAKFVRKAAMFQSADGGNSGTFVSSAELVSSKPFKMGGKTFNLKDLIPQGMNCFESADGNYEVGTCVAFK
jgi:hypothetical protein